MVLWPSCEDEQEANLEQLCHRAAQWSVSPPLSVFTFSLLHPICFLCFSFLCVFTEQFVSLLLKNPASHTVFLLE